MAQAMAQDRIETLRLNRAEFDRVCAILDLTTDLQRAAYFDVSRAALTKVKNHRRPIGLPMLTKFVARTTGLTTFEALFETVVTDTAQSA